jgi:hypothetical protein
VTEACRRAQGKMTVFVRAKGVRLHTITVGRHCGELDGSDVELLVGANVSGASAPGGGGVPEAKGEGEPGGFHMEGVRGAFAEPRGSDGRDEAPSHRSE